MEEPLLPAIIADEAEAAITHEPFDSACRHRRTPYVAGLALQYQQTSAIWCRVLRRNKASSSASRSYVHSRCTMPALSRSAGGGDMARERLTAVAAAASFGLATAIIAAQGRAVEDKRLADKRRRPGPGRTGTRMDRHPRMRRRSPPIPRWRRVRDAADRRFRRRAPRSKAPTG